MSWSFYLAIPLMAILIVIQSTVLPHIRIFGVVPQVVFVVTLAWSMLHGLREGILWAFIAGILIDLFSAGPIGVTSLALMAAVTVTVLIQRNFPDNRVVLPVLLTVLATIVFWLIYLLLIRIIMPLLISGLPFLDIDRMAGNPDLPGFMRDITAGYGINQAVFGFILLSAVVHSLLILPIYWLFYLAERTVRPRRVEL